MEKTNFSKTDGVFDETTKMTNKWLADTCSVMTNFYDKQLKTAMGFYTNLFDSFSGSDKGRYTNMNFISPFFAGINFYKSMMSPFNAFRSDYSFVDSFTTHFEDLNKQMREFNTRLFTLFMEDLKNRQVNWNAFNKVIEEEWKTAQNSINSFQEAYMKRLNHSLEFNKKLVREMSDEFEMAASRNKKMWADLLKTTEMNSKTEQEKEPERKDGQSKKQGKTELTYH
jgi:hypothetical protein